MNTENDEGGTGLEELPPENPVQEAADAGAQEVAPEPVPEVGLPRSPLLLNRHDSAILVIDVQTKLLPSIQANERLTWNIRRLLDGARVLGVMRLCTEQYPQGLGHTTIPIAGLVEVDDEKRLFSCRTCENVRQRLDERGIRKLLLCGIETHVCVQQSALDLLAGGFEVWLATDACGSRFVDDHQVALRRMELAGVTLTTTESVLFEWCESSEAPEFRRISELVREKPPEAGSPAVPGAFPRIIPEYTIQTDHQMLERESGAVQTQLVFIVRKTDDGSEVIRFSGASSAGIAERSDARSGVTAAEMGSDGATVSVQKADGKIEMVYLPVSPSLSRHPRWKIRRYETFINSPQYGNDFRITYQVIEYATGNVFREFHGYEHRMADGRCSLMSGVRRIEVSRDGLWVSVLSTGRSPEVIALPPENP